MARQSSARPALQSDRAFAAEAVEGYHALDPRPHSAVIASHLLRLDADARRRRFLTTAEDSFVDRYAASLAQSSALICGWFADGVLRAIGELHLSEDPGRHAEAAVSVEEAWWPCCVGATLFDWLLRTARRHGCRTLECSCLVTDHRMRQLLRQFRAGLRGEGDEIVGTLSLRPG